MNEIIVGKIGKNFRVVIKKNKWYVHDEDYSGITVLWIDKNTGEVLGLEGKTGKKVWVSPKLAESIIKRSLERRI
jgi:hypothetical protein